MNKLYMEGYMAQQGSWNFASEELRERGALRKEEGDAVREHKTMHEENWLSSWLREDGREKEKRTANVSEEDEEERCEEKRRGERREQNGESPNMM